MISHDQIDKPSIAYLARPLGDPGLMIRILVIDYCYGIRLSTPDMVRDVLGYAFAKGGNRSWRMRLSEERTAAATRSISAMRRCGSKCTPVRKPWRYSSRQTSRRMRKSGDGLRYSMSRATFSAKRQA